MLQNNYSIESNTLTITSEVLKSIRDDLCCSICLGIFQNCIVTPCLHRFCKDCIKRYLQQFQANTDEKRKCPNCKQRCSHRQIINDKRVNALILLLGLDVNDAHLDEGVIGRLQEARKLHQENTLKIQQIQNKKRNGCLHSDRSSPTQIGQNAVYVNFTVTAHPSLDRQKTQIQLQAFSETTINQLREFLRWVISIKSSVPTIDFLRTEITEFHPSGVQISCDRKASDSQEACDLTDNKREAVISHNLAKKRKYDEDNFKRAPSIHEVVLYIPNERSKMMSRIDRSSATLGQLCHWCADNDHAVNIVYSLCHDK